MAGAPPLSRSGQCLFELLLDILAAFDDEEDDLGLPRRRLDVAVVIEGDVTDDAVELGEGGELSDLAPTILAMLGLPIPADMTGTSLATEA